MARISNVFSFRGIILPWRSRDAGFEHETVQHRRLHRPRAAIEQLGPGPVTVTYELPLDDGANLGYWNGRRLYSEDLRKLWGAMWDRSPGSLYDAVWREVVQVVPTGRFSESAGHSRSGVNATVSFLLDDTEDDEPFPGEGLKALADQQEQLNTIIEPIALPPEAPDAQALANPLAIAQGYVAQGEAYAEQVSAAIEGYAGQLQELAETLEKATDPLAWQVVPLVNTLRFRAERTAQSLGAAGANVVAYTVRSDITLSALAREVGADRDLLLRLNVDLARAGYVKAGTQIQVPGA